MTKLADRLDSLSRRVNANVPRHDDPEAFHVEKDDIAQELKRIARESANRER